jgi:glycosyltransferase involved in cell wall biosynthesis
VSTVVVDWLGRGGIAQTSEAWARALRSEDVECAIVTRGSRELDAGDLKIVGAGDSGRVRAHRAVAAAAAREIRSRRPRTVVVQNYVIPVLESPVYAAARDVGARTVLVVHDHRMHTLLAGTHLGLTREMRRVDEVVAHSEFVASVLTTRTGRAVRVVPHPVPVGVLRHRRPEPAEFTGGELVAAHFGVLRRGYKGTRTVEGLAGRAHGWVIVTLGVGAPAPRSGLVSIRGWVEPGALAANVGRADVVVLPYRFATQSGAVVLAQALGTVPIATAVGGIPEQITSWADGVLVAPDAPQGAWLRVLDDLRDHSLRAELSATARDRAWSGHRRFVRDVAELAA